MILKKLSFFLSRVSWQFETLILLITYPSILYSKTTFCGSSVTEEVEGPTVPLLRAMAPAEPPWRAAMF